MRINHNIAALNTYRQLGTNQTASSKNMEKLSSGMKINRAGDDAAGLAISEKMRGQIRGLDMAAKNAQDGISLIQTAEGALNETHSILQRMRELAVQAGNDTNNDQDRGEIQKEINQLTSEINRIGNTTEFNTQKLLNGEKSTELSSVDVLTTLAGVTADGTATPPITEVKGQYQFDFSNYDFNIDGIALNYDSTGVSGYKDVDTLVAQINGDGTLGAKYTASNVNGKIQLEQNTGNATAPNIKLVGTSITLQIGANENQSMSMEIKDLRASALGITGVKGSNGFTDDNSVNNGTNNMSVEAALSVETHESAAAAITKIQSAIDTVSGERSKLGAYQNRLEHTINNLGASSENLSAAESRIRDTDMAKEMMEMTKNNILQQAAQAMLAQANQQPQGVLQLLR
ncbi:MULTISPECIES: flagellin N-terminal helical domain-containing protein [Bacillus]|uniref:flagellin N-terminal helical domain-containing protein n=1 Tax=Bacillus TaxID=1386 RepID=UPI0003199D2C|nr:MULTISPECIES: flagellin [Bacillus]